MCLCVKEDATRGHDFKADEREKVEERWRARERERESERIRKFVQKFNVYSFWRLYSRGPEVKAAAYLSLTGYDQRDGIRFGPRERKELLSLIWLRYV